MNSRIEQSLGWELVRVIKDYSVDQLFEDDSILEYVKKNFNPDDVFDEAELVAWATKYGLM